VLLNKEAERTVCIHPYIWDLV